MASKAFWCSGGSGGSCSTSSAGGGASPAGDGAGHAVLRREREHLVDDRRDLGLGLHTLEERHGLALDEGEAHRHGLHLEGLQDRGVGVDVDGDELEAAGVAAGHGAEGRDEVGRLLEPWRPQHHDDGVPVGRRDDVADRGVSALDDEASTVRRRWRPRAEAGPAGWAGRLSDDRSTAPRSAAAVNGW